MHPFASTMFACTIVPSKRRDSFAALGLESVLAKEFVFMNSALRGMQ